MPGVKRGHTVADTFDDHWIEQEGPLDTPCHIWQRATNGRYGQLRHGGRLVPAHVFAWSRRFGQVPKGKQLNHQCDTPLCVNEAHLTLATQSENLVEASARGRKGILTPMLVIRLRKAYIPGDPQFGASALARKLGLKRSTVYAAISGQNWGHL